MKGRAFLFATIMVLAMLPVRAETPAVSSPSDPAAAVAGSAAITDPDAVHRHLREVLSRPAFQDQDETDINSRLSEWLSQWFGRVGATIGDFKYGARVPQIESLVMALLVCSCVALLIYIIARLMRRRGGFNFDFERPTFRRRVFRAPELYDDEIARALQQRDWRSAWLASWRQFLSRLESRQLVDADRTRTNREYLAQLRAQILPATAVTLLASAVDAYDQFIYGRKAIEENDWNLFHRQMNEAGLLLHLDDKPTVQPAQAITA